MAVVAPVTVAVPEVHVAPESRLPPTEAVAPSKEADPFANMLTLTCCALAGRAQQIKRDANRVSFLIEIAQI